MNEETGKEIVDEERVRRVLSELREKPTSKEVASDIERLERILNNPVFRQHSQKERERLRAQNSLSIAPPIPSSHRPRASVHSPRVERLKKELGGQLNGVVRDNQVDFLFLRAYQKNLTYKVVFAEIDVSEDTPEVIEELPKQDSKEQRVKLIVSGPTSIKEKSSNRVRIGDCLLGSSCSSEAVAAAPTGQAGVADSAAESLPSGAAPAAASVFLFARASRPAAAFAASVAAARAAPPPARLAVALLRTRKVMVLTGEWVQVEVIRLSTDSGGLGFGIVGGASTGVVVKTVLPGSPAAKDNKLKPGDHILHIGTLSTQGFSSQQVATILRQQEHIVEMVVARPISFADRPPDRPTCWTMPTRAALCPQTLEEQLARRQAAGAAAPGTSIEPTPEEEPTAAATAACATSEAPAEPNGRPVAAHVNGGVQRQQDEQQQRQQELSAPMSERASDYRTRRKPSEESTTSGNGGGGPSGAPDAAPADATATAAASIASEVGTDAHIAPSMSLRSLQEMALTVFCRENWSHLPYETIDVELKRDAALGLGITVAGYVHRKEEIGGIFVKSLVPRSAAAISCRIKVHDLILEVNDASLEHVSHADSVRALVRSGSRIRLRLIRFPVDSPQALCLKMLQKQETDTQVIDVQSSNPQLMEEWKRRLPEDVDIVSAVIRPDPAGADAAADGGLGISLEGTVDVVDGAQLCPHHYVESLRDGGPAARSGLLQAGDELLQVNHFPLYGESHVTVRQALARAAASRTPVTIVVARKVQIVNFFSPRFEHSLPASYPLLALGSNRIVKAKSEVCVPSPIDTALLLEQVSRRLRSRSLEPLAGLAVWNCIPLVVHLMKDTRGLGFSIVDYRDPVHPGESVIVVQSLVPGGVAQADGRIVPGDRLLFVNDHDLSNSSLERAVSVLKAAPMGRVRLGIAKPHPVDQERATSHSPMISRSERLLAKRASPRLSRRQAEPTSLSQETVWIGAEQYRRLHPQGYFPSRSPSAHSDRSLDFSDVSMSSFSPCSTRSMSPAGSPIRGQWAYDVIYLPAHLERSIKITKGALSLGLVVDTERDKGVNGCVVKSICSKKALGLDGRLQMRDYVVKVNTECMRNVTAAQARAIIKRANLIGATCNITYITASDAKLWKERFHRPEPQPAPVSRLSPKVFPKFYRSPFLSRRVSHQTDQETSEMDAANSTCASPQPLSECLHLTSSTGAAAIPSGSSSPPSTSRAPPEQADDAIGQGEAPCSTCREDITRSTESPSKSTTVSSSQKKRRSSRQAELERARATTSFYIDSAAVDEFVYEMVESCLADALIDVAVSSAVPDWRGRPPLPPPLTHTPSPDQSHLSSPRRSRDLSPPKSFSTVRGETPPDTPDRESAIELIAEVLVGRVLEETLAEYADLWNCSSSTPLERAVGAPLKEVEEEAEDEKEQREGQSEEPVEKEERLTEGVERILSNHISSLGSEEREGEEVLDRSSWPPPDEVLVRRDSSPALQRREARSIVDDIIEQLDNERHSPKKTPASPSIQREDEQFRGDTEEQSEATHSGLSVSIDQELSFGGTSSSADFVNNHAMRSPKSKFWGEVRTVLLERQPNKSFGISIVGGRVEVSQKGGLPGTGNTVSGIFIKSVLENSPAGQSGVFHMGDRVLAVNDTDLRDATHEEAVAAIKNASNPVRFLLQSLHSFNPHQAVRGSASTSTVGSIRLETSRGGDEIAVVREESPQRQPNPLERKQPSPPPSVRPANETPKKEAIVAAPSSRRLSSGSTGAGAKRDSITSNGGSRKSSAANKPPTPPRTAPRPGEERPLIVSDVSSSETKDEEDEEAAAAALQLADAARPAPPPPAPATATRDAPAATRHVTLLTPQEDDDDNIARLADAGIEPGSAAALPREEDDEEEETPFFYTQKKLSRKYDSLGGEILLMRLESVPEAGLGLSLAGTKDRLRQTPAVLVVAVKVACPLSVRVGDELLEVCGRVLAGLTHIAASHKIRECCERSYMEMVVLRRPLNMVEMPTLSEENSSSVEAEVVEEENVVQLPSDSIEQERENRKRSEMGGDQMTSPPTTASNVENTLQSVENVRKKSWAGGGNEKAPIEAGKESPIQIDKDGKGLGLSIVGGADTVLGTVVIHEVYSDGAAAADGRLRPGDQVLEVNGVSLRGVPHEQAISLLRRTPPKVRLLIYRDSNLQMSLLDPTQIYNILEVELTKRPGRGLGLSIVGRKNEPGVYVSEVVKGGAAEADGRLMTGDQILAINGEDVASSMQEDVAATLKTCVGKVALKIGRWKITEATDRVHAAAEAAFNRNAQPHGKTTSPAGAAPLASSATSPRPIITRTPPEGEGGGAGGDPAHSGATQSAGLSPVAEEPNAASATSSSDQGTAAATASRAAAGTKAPPTMHASAKKAVSPVGSGASTASSCSAAPAASTVVVAGTDIKLLPNLKEDGSDTLLIELRKIPEQQLGMGIGKRTRGILVTSLQPGSAAAEKLKVGDRLLAVNALPVTDQLSAVTFVKASGERLFLQVARPRSTPTA